MTNKSLVYMMLAVAVGYILVSAVPQQVAMYTTPQQMLTAPAGSDGTLTEGSDAGVLGTPESAEPPLSMKGSGDNGVRTSMVESSRIFDLMKWWTVDIMVALTIYWVARRRFV